MKASTAIIVGVSVALGALRFTVPGVRLSWQDTYEAFAHLWMGGLIVWFVKEPPSRGVVWLAGGAITALEAAVFLLHR